MNKPYFAYVVGGRYMLKKMALSLVAAFGFGISAQAATLDFVVDGANSFVQVTDQTGGGRLCRRTDCEIFAELDDDLDGRAFSLGETERERFDFFNITAEGSTNLLRPRVFSISAVLAFSAPDVSVGSTGVGGFIFFEGFLEGGVLAWDNDPQRVVLDNGSIFAVNFQDLTPWIPNQPRAQRTIHATVRAVNVVPLPASALFLLAGVGGLALMRRKASAA